MGPETKTCPRIDPDRGDEDNIGKKDSKPSNEGVLKSNAKFEFCLGSKVPETFALRE